MHQNWGLPDLIHYEKVECISQRHLERNHQCVVIFWFSRGSRVSSLVRVAVCSTSLHSGEEGARHIEALRKIHIQALVAQIVVVADQEAPSLACSLLHSVDPCDPPPMRSTRRLIKAAYYQSGLHSSDPKIMTNKLRCCRFERYRYFRSRLYGVL